MIKKAINKETNEEYKSLIQLTKLNARQFAVITDMKAYIDTLRDAKDTSDADKERYAKYQITRKECYLFHCAVRDVHSAAYFITKNKACEVRNTHLRDLTRFTLDKNAVAVSEEKTDDKALTTATKKAAKKATAKKTVAKRDKKATKKEETKQDVAITSEETSEALALLS